MAGASWAALKNVLYALFRKRVQDRRNRVSYLCFMGAWGRYIFAISDMTFERARRNSSGVIEL